MECASSCADLGTLFCPCCHSAVCYCACVGVGVCFQPTDLRLCLQDIIYDVIMMIIIVFIVMNVNHNAAESVSVQSFPRIGVSLSRPVFINNFSHLVEN